MFKNYQLFYKKLSAPLREAPVAVGILKQLSKFLTGFIYLVYPCLLIFVFWRSWQNSVSFEGYLVLAFPYLIIPALSFILLTVIRKLINQPRPYEQWHISPLIEKKTKGNSMPSRHVFSATVIAMCGLKVNLILGIFLLILSVIIAFIRVIGGVHYPIDVIIGFLAGVLTGLCLFLVR